MENEKLTWVTKPKGKRFYVVRWIDPATNKTRQRSTGFARRRDAQSVADDIAKEVFAGRAEKDVSWRRFCERYVRERLADRSPKTVRKWKTAARLITKHLKPKSTRDLSSDRLSRMVGKLLDAGMTPGTLDSHLRHIHAGLTFAVDIGQLPAVPKIAKPKGKRHIKHMRGRPVTGEEFDRYIEAISTVPKVIPTDATDGWEHLAKGLWHSGLRLSEALELGWDEDWPIQVHKIDGRRPMLLIPAEYEKGGQDRILPITPDFAAFLRATPENERSGKVFRPLSFRGPVQTMQTVSDKLSEVGEAAKIVVERDKKTGKVKYASAHDFRRSFGTRWAARVMPAVLQQLMRHANIKTTMKYYVSQNAEQFADVVWEAGTSDRDPVRDPKAIATRKQSKKP